MTKARRYPILAGLSLVLGLSAFGQDNRPSKVVVITNSETALDEISAEDLKSIFLGTKMALKGGIRVEPVVAKSGPAHAAFLRSYLSKTDVALQIYYRSLVFSGQGSMPATVSSDAEVIAFVEKTRGAIGYVAASSDIGSAKALRIK
jgi:ABC-type phosphate transport system substrate-binding protein